jgi:hypothetical protein
MTKLLVLLTSAVLATSCRAREEPDGSEGRDERPTYSKSSETAQDDFEHTRKTYEVHINDRLRKLDMRIRELADRGTEKARAAAARLREERDLLAPRLDEVKQQAKAGWDRFESEVSQGFDTIERKLDAAFAD